MVDAAADDDYGSGERPSKRARTDDLAGLSATVPRTRGPTACEKCRSRKTKCDNRRPSCGYCVKNNISCIYTEEAEVTPCGLAEARILEAIENLSNRLLQPCHPCSHQKSPCWPQSLQGNLSSFSSHDDVGAVAGMQPSELIEQGHSTPQGMESILEWKVLAPFRPPRFFTSFEAPTAMQTYVLPKIDQQELSRLASKYITGVHFKNPIIDVDELDRLISHVAENGLDWSSKTCLVTIVCAIGAIAQPYVHPGNSSRSSPNFDLIGSEPELSMQFWNIAVKRLGIVIGQNDSISVQCLCLAGIWFMHQMEPLQAWKYFNMAGAAWYSLSITTNPEFFEPLNVYHYEQSFSVSQSLFFTIWKSECELQLELSLPRSILESASFPHAFPDPPDLDHGNLARDVRESTQGWFYYLSEIAIRHLLNRILRTHQWKSKYPDEKEIRQLLAQSDLLEMQLRDWYLSLPPTLHFDIPDGFEVQPHSDDLIQILRSRYLSCRELIARPFVKLCVENSLEIDPQLRFQVAALASQSLRICMLRLTQAVPYRHQGSWFLIRSTASSSLILAAVHLASKSSFLKGVQQVILPMRWKETVLEALELLGPDWEENGKVEIKHMKKIVHSVLDACS